MEAIVKGRTQFNAEALKGADLEQLIEDHKQTTSEAHCIEAWEEVNGKYNPKKKKAPRENEPRKE